MGGLRSRGRRVSFIRARGCLLRSCHFTLPWCLIVVFLCGINFFVKASLLRRQQPLYVLRKLFDVLTQAGTFRPTNLGFSQHSHNQNEDYDCLSKVSPISDKFAKTRAEALARS